MNVLLATFGTRGDLQPMFALALGLAERGHSATVAGPPDFAAWAARLGVTYASVGDSIERLTRATPATSGRRPSREDLPGLRSWYSEQYAPLAPLVEAADVVVSTGVTSAPLDLAEKLDPSGGAGQRLSRSGCFWADRLVRRGVAGPPVTARRHRVPELAAAFRAVVEDDGLRERARALKARLREDGVARMIAALERPLD